MSRRIAYCILAAAAVLTAAPAQADRECFENSCRMPDVVEPPPPAAAQSAPLPDPDDGARGARASGAEAGGAPDPAAAATTGTARAQSPGGIYPQMIVDHGTRKPKAAPRAPARAVQRYPDSAPTPVAAPPALAPAAVAAVPAVATAHPRMRPVVVSAPTYVETAPKAAAAVIGVPAAIYADDGVVAAYPDPSWKLCQIDEPGVRPRYYRCGPYSYHPYGEHGYRPYGSYRSYRSAPAYVVAPNAKIISIQTED
jgi:hypothetical protein